MWLPQIVAAAPPGAEGNLLALHRVARRQAEALGSEPVAASVLDTRAALDRVVWLRLAGVTAGPIEDADAVVVVDLYSAAAALLEDTVGLREALRRVVQEPRRQPGLRTGAGGQHISDERPVLRLGVPWHDKGATL